MEAAAVVIRTDRYDDFAVVICYQLPNRPLLNRDLQAILET